MSSGFTPRDTPTVAGSPTCYGQREDTFAAVAPNAAAALIGEPPKQLRSGDFSASSGDVTCQRPPQPGQPAGGQRGANAPLDFVHARHGCAGRPGLRDRCQRLFRLGAELRHDRLRRRNECVKLLGRRLFLFSWVFRRM